MTPSPKKTSVLPSGGGAVLMNPSDTVILLLDHQSGLFQTVKDIPVADLRRNVEMIARLTLLNSGYHDRLGARRNQWPADAGDSPTRAHAVYVPRKGEVNARDNDGFVAQVEATGRRTLVMAGVWTSVCVMFPALDAKVAGYEVYAVVDASGDPSEMASRTSLARFVQGGVKPASTNALLSELHRTWARPEAASLAQLYGLVAPNYAAVPSRSPRSRCPVRTLRSHLVSRSDERKLQRWSWRDNAPNSNVPETLQLTLREHRVRYWACPLHGEADLDDATELAPVGYGPRSAPPVRERLYFTPWTGSGCPSIRIWKTK